MNIDCICVEVSFTKEGWENKDYVSKLERNVKFDTGLKDFGEIEHLIFSKVNEKENMLKLKNTKEDLSIYVMVDEFGYTWDKRFIFKSSWDSDYYVRTKTNIRTKMNISL